MKKLTKAGKRYAIAHNAQYKTEDTHKAFLMYCNIIKHYPEDREADYSRVQLQNIMKSVIPEKTINSTMDMLVTKHFSAQASAAN